MKAVIYYEGPSERCMLNHLLYQACQPINLTEDYLEYLTTPNNQNSILLYDCDGYQNVFPDIADTPDLYANNERIIIIRDLETTQCFVQLKDELYDHCPELPEIRTRSIFAKYTLEHLYLANLNIFKRVFCSMYEDNRGEPIPDNNRFEEIIENLNPIRPNFARLFRAYGMAFNKPAIADEFFAKFDFRSSNHPYFVRLFQSLEEVIQIIQ